jgi:peptidoglycan/LPS O-acetylase OafA/YrhL
MNLRKIFSLTRLQRVTTSDKIIPEIDGLRFLAIISVVVFHLRTHLLRTTTFNLSNQGVGETVDKLISNGGFGVNIFFAISGFILALPFASHYLKGTKKVDLKAYYLRRLTRLEPPYFIIMTIFFLVSVVYLGSPLKELFPHYLVSLGYSHFIVYGEWSTINPVAWSLETEVQFYLIAPLLFMIFKVKGRDVRRLAIFLTAIILCLIYFRLFDLFIQLHIYKSLLAYLPYFCVGILFGDYYLQNVHAKQVKKSHIWDIIGIASTIILFWFNPNDSFWNTLILIVSLFFVFLSAFRGTLLNRFYTTPFIYITGGMCYTIYLIHYAFIAFIMNQTSKVGFEGSLLFNLLIQALIILPILFIVSSSVFLLFEKPFMQKNWPNRFRSFFQNKSSHVIR